MTQKAVKALINYGGIDLEVYQLPNGDYTLSQTQVGKAITKGHRSLGDFLKGKSPEALSVKDFIEQHCSVTIGDGGLKISVSHPAIILAYWKYWARKGNVKAISILKAIYNTPEQNDLIFSKYRDKNILILSGKGNEKKSKSKDKSYIYLIQAGSLDVVKIGISKRPRHRLNTLQTSHYETLRIIALKEGGIIEENNLHIKFKDFHIRGEWFKFTDEIKMEFNLPLNIEKYLSVVNKEDFGRT